MDTFTVRDLRERTGDLVRACEAGSLSLLTKHGKPLCITVPMDDLLLRHGIPSALAVQLYRSQSVSIGVARRIAGIDLEQFMDLLGSLGIPVMDYDPHELDQELLALG